MGTYYAEKFAALLAALKGIDDGGGQTALYNSSVVLGMECWSNSSSGHYLTDIPFILAGQGGGQVPDRPHRRRRQAATTTTCSSRSRTPAGIASSTFGLASLCKGPIV